MRKTTRAAAALVGALVLAGCGGASGGSGAAAPPTSGSEQPEAPAGEAVLATADSDLGTIVVDSAGRTVYVFDEDEAGSGQSACSGDCLTTWPPVVADRATPAVDGVTGEVGTIERDDGTLQVTLDGAPLYAFAGDAAAGDVTGQSVDDVWWVLDPAGDKITDAPPADEPGGDPGFTY